MCLICSVFDIDFCFVPPTFICIDALALQRSNLDGKSRKQLGVVGNSVKRRDWLNCPIWGLPKIKFSFLSFLLFL